MTQEDIVLAAIGIVIVFFIVLMAVLRPPKGPITKRGTL